MPHKNHTKLMPFSELIKANYMTIFFVVFGATGFSFIHVSGALVAGEVFTRFLRNVLTAMALIIPIWAGMGLNFNIITGAVCSQIAMILAVNYGFSGNSGIIRAFIMTLIFASALGILSGFIINRMKNREMITSMMLGLFVSSIYEFIAKTGFGTFIPVKNKELLLSSGIGIRNIVNLEILKSQLTSKYIFYIIAVIFVSFLIIYIKRTTLGTKFKALKAAENKAQAAEISTKSVRITAILISTMLAATGHFIFMLQIGTVSVYTGHLNIEIFGAAAIIAGGATIQNANIRNAMIGIVLFHFMYAVSPLFAKAVFGKAFIGEYLRSMIAYGVIIVALLVNNKQNGENYEIINRQNNSRWRRQRR